MSDSMRMAIRSTGLKFPRAYAENGAEKDACEDGTCE